MELKNVLLEKEGHLAIVTINRPKALNALNSDTIYPNQILKIPK